MFMADNNPRRRGEEDEENKRSAGFGRDNPNDFDDDFNDDLEDDLADDLDDDWDDGDLDDDLEDDFEDDDDFDEDDEEGGDEQNLLLEQFQGGDYRVVDLKQLNTLDDIEEEELTAVEPTLTLEEVLYRLVREEDELPANEMAVFADLSRADAEQVRRVWPQISLMRRRVVTATIAEQYAVYLGMDYGAFLRIALDDSDAAVRGFAVIGLSEEGAAQDLLGRYVQILQSEGDVELRAAAAAALGAYILEGELEELDSALSMRAEQALMAVLTNRREPVAVQCRALESIAYSGELGVRQLIEEAYYAPEEARRLSALVAMGRSADIRWRRLVRAELTNPDPAMRAQAAYACGELEARSALRELLDLLQDPKQEVRLAAMFALGHIGGPQARDALQEVVENGDEVEAGAAEEALEEMDFYAGAEAAATPLFDETEDEEDDTWGEAPEWESDEDDDNLGEYE